MSDGMMVSARRIGVGWLLVIASPCASAHGTHSLLLAHMDTALAEQPENGGLWYQRALLDFEHEDLAEGLLDLEKAARFAPGKFPVLWLKGRILDAAGKPEEALSALDSFIASSPDHWSALASRARVEDRLGMQEKALADFRAALAHHPEAGPDLVQEVAEALATHGFTDESVRVLEKALSRLGPVPALQMKLLGIEISAGRHDSALARLEGFQKSAPRPEPWMAKRAGLLTLTGHLTESRTAWQELLDHIRRLPAEERDCHAMAVLSGQAREALSGLASATSPNTRFP